jgi:lysophospholipase L1-like esterase
MKTTAVILYLVGLHLLAAVLLVQSGLIPRIGARLGWMRTSNQADPAYVQIILDCHDRLDGNVPDGAVVFVGDSLVQGLCVSAVAPVAVNYGMAGDTTAGVLRRLPRYGSLARAGAVVIAVGVNDVKSISSAEILRNWGAILDRLPADVPTVCGAILPLDETVRRSWRGLNHSDIRPLNAGLETLVQSRPNAVWVDPTPVLVDADGNLRREFHDGDGLHLNSRGNAVWISSLRTAVARALQSDQRTAVCRGPPLAEDSP